MSGIGGVGGNFNVNDLTSFEAPKQSGFSKFGSILSAVGSAVPGAGVVGGALSALGGGGERTPASIASTSCSNCRTRCSRKPR